MTWGNKLPSPKRSIKAPLFDIHVLNESNYFIVFRWQKCDHDRSCCGIGWKSFSDQQRAEYQELCKERMQVIYCYCSACQMIITVKLITCRPPSWNMECCCVFDLPLTAVEMTPLHHVLYGKLPHFLYYSKVQCMKPTHNVCHHSNQYLKMIFTVLIRK